MFLFRTVQPDISRFSGEILQAIIRFLHNGGLGRYLVLVFYAVGCLLRLVTVPFQHDLADVPGFGSEVVPGALFDDFPILTNDEDVVC